MWIIVFLSVVRTLVLMAPIHCRGSTGDQVTHLHFKLLWFKGEYIFSKFSLLGELFCEFF